MAQTITIDIVAETRRLQAGIADANRQLSGIQTGVQNVQNLGAAVAGVGVAAAGFGLVGRAIKDTSSDASELEQQFGGLDAVFKDNAEEMKNFSENAYNLGISTVDAARSSVLLGAAFKGAGFDIDTVTGQTQSLLNLSADLAAQFGGSSAEAVAALGSAFRGEFNPIERYSVNLRKSDVNARLAAKGLDGLTGQALKQAEIVATLELIFEASSDAIGANAREQDTLAAKQGQLAAVTENLSAQLGEVLLPVLTKISEALINIIDFFSGLPRPVQNTILAFGALAAILGPAVLLTSSLITAFTTIKGVLGGFTIASRAAAIAQGAFNLVLSLNPLTLVALAIAAVVAALALFFTQTETGRQIWQSFTKFVSDTVANLRDFFAVVWEKISAIVIDTFAVISNVVNTALNFIKGIFQGTLEVIRRLVEGDFTVVKEIIENVFKAIRVFLDTILNVIFGIIKFYIEAWSNIFKTGFNLIKTIVEGVINGIRDFVNGGFERMVNGAITAFNNLRDAAGRIWGDIKSKITGFVTNIINAFGEIPTKMLDLGRNIVEGIWNGISGLTNWFKDKILNFFGGLLPGWVKDVLGIKSPSKVFEDIGKDIVEGTARGLDTPALRRPEGLAGQTPINITINAGLGTDPYALGRTVTNAINKYSRVSGSGGRYIAL